MADDALGMRGLAQVLNRPNMGNMYALQQMKQKQEADRAAALQKKQQQDADDFKTQIKLGELPVLESKMTKSLVDARGVLLNGFNQIYTHGEKYGFTPEMRQTASEMKQKYQAAEDQAQAFQQDVTQLKATLHDSLPILKDSAVSQKYNDLTNNAFTEEKDGSLSFNKDSLVKMRELPNDPTIYDPLKMADSYVKELGKISQDLFSPDANISDQRKFSNVFLQDSHGNPILDKRTGRPLVDSSPQAIAQWNAKGEVWEKALKMYADKDFGGDVQRAHSSLMRAVADYGSVKSKINSPIPGYNNFNAPELSNAFTTANNSLDEIRKNGGVSGYSGKEANLQWFGTPDQRTVRLKDQNGRDVDGEILKFGIGNVGKGPEKGVWVAELDPKGKGRQSVFIPIRGGENDPNLKTVLDASLKFDKKGNVRNDVLNQYRQVERSAVAETNIDEAKVSDVISSIGDSFKKTDTGWPSDEDAASEVSDKLKSLGVTKIKTTTSTGTEKYMPLKVEADVANWFGSHKISINGKQFDMDSEDDVNKLTNLIYDNSNPENFNASKSAKKLSIAEQMKQAAR